MQFIITDVIMAMAWGSNKFNQIKLTSIYI
jgi:hypothetical protein